MAFHVAGIVQEFPSAPKDSFMVANLSYLESVTHAGGPNVIFARASGDHGQRRPQGHGRHRADGTKVDNIPSSPCRRPARSPPST